MVCSMFDWLKKLFDAKKYDDSLFATITAPGTTITYSPALMVQLTTEHRQLLEIFREIQVASNRGEYKKIILKLGQFRSLLQGHLLVENVRLYIYLERMFADDTENYELIREVRKEMDGISRSALAFLEKYEGLGIDRDLEISFTQDLEAFGTLMMHRIETEERVLYPLYHQ